MHPRKMLFEAFVIGNVPLLAEKTAFTPMYKQVIGQKAYISGYISVLDSKMMSTDLVKREQALHFLFNRANIV